MAMSADGAATPPGAGSAPAYTALCRDCGRRDPPGPRCPACGGRRIVRHAELATLTIAHVDCDAFYATIEKRDNPALRDRPVIVGGRGRRGVVAAACYLARTRGVHSAMPMFQALRACPGAAVIAPDMEKYVGVARQVRAAMLALTPLVEPLSIDEAFLDLAGTQRLHGMGPAESLAGLARTVERDIGITISVGLSCNKFLAKIASDLDKPRGFAVIGRTGVREFLAGQPVGLIWGVGAAMQARLARDGIRRIADLQALDRATLAARYGAAGARLAALANGEDTRAVDPVRAAKSFSAETTFAEDIADPDELARLLWRLAEKTAGRLKRAGLAGHTVTLKLKGADFRTLTRARTLADPTRLAERIYRTALPLLAREARGRAFRLLGVGVSELVSARDADRGDLADRDTVSRLLRAEDAIDAVRAKYGPAALLKGRAWNSGDRG